METYFQEEPDVMASCFNLFNSTKQCHVATPQENPKEWEQQSFLGCTVHKHKISSRQGPLLKTTLLHCMG